MAVEIPFALIRNLQATAREEAGLAHYDPSDPAIGALPTLHDAISGLDPDAPPYLRCRNCHGKLLRGIQTIVCVYCGAEQRKDGLPFTISFNSTAACKLLLQALDLDGSEPISLQTDSRDSGKSEGMMKAGLFLSDILDLEVVWPPEEKQEDQSSSTRNIVNSSQSYPSFNVAGADLDNIFSKSKSLGDSDGIKKPQYVPKNENVASTDACSPSGFGNIDAFGTVQSNAMRQGCAETEASYSVESFADWDADFQSAGSKNTVEDTKTIDPFPGSLSNTLNKQTSRGFGFESKEVKKHSFTNESLFPNDVWQTKDVKISDVADYMKTDSTTDNFKNVPKKLPSNDQKIDGENDDSFGIWKDFTNSRGAQEASSDPWSQVGENSMQSNEHFCELNAQNQIDMFDDMEFGSFVQSVTPESNLSGKNNLPNRIEDMEFGSFFDCPPAVTEEKNDITNTDKLNSDITGKLELPDSFEDMEFGSFLQSNPSEIVDGKNVSVDKSVSKSNTSFVDSANITNATSENSTSTVETDFRSSNLDNLLSQMNDLSFMLDSNLSIPKSTKS